MYSQKRIALITGASQGIGLSITETLLNDRVGVIMTGENQEKLDEEASRLKKEGKQVKSFKMDVSCESNVKRVFAEINEEYGRLDILINNAGISPKINGKSSKIIDTSLEEWNKVIQVNLTGAFLCVREALPLMMNNNWGRVINMSSQAGRTFSRVAGTHYSASKSGLIGFTRNLAAEYGKFGITANCIAPGRIISPMVSEVSSEKNEEFVKIAPVGRLGQPEEVAAAVSFLCSEEAGYITGVTVDVNGGMFMN
ncbi:SDR family NAD(P)-dependent oxidoreductase [Peribacillus butanolivorans]|uniref:SDR family NAD(P)-dependent oxidoreductase n=1 Tax=Peribacillus butanolivorans TaxID=421767 RepID=UPI003668B965